MKHAPDVDVLVALDVEDEVRIAPQRPKAQIGKPELMRIARRPRRWLTCDVGVGFFERVNKPNGNPCRGFDQVTVDRFVYVPVRKFPRNDAFQALHLGCRFLIVSRSPAKYAVSAGAAGSEPAPASSNPRK